MKKMTLGSSPPLKSLYGLPTEDLNEAPIDLKEHYRNYLDYLEIVRMHFNMPVVIQKKIENKLTEEQLDTLEWAKEFLNGYERKKSSTRKSK